MPSSPASTPGSEHEWCAVELLSTRANIDVQHRDPFGPNLIIHIGSDAAQTTFKVSESLICHYSSYFKVMSTSPILNYTTGEIRLPGESPEVFDMVLHYLRTRRFFESSVHPSLVLSFDKIIDIWSFGDRRAIPLVQNAATDLLAHKIKFSKELPDRWSLEYLWEKTPSGSLLRIMLVELIRAMWIPDGHRHHVWQDLVGGTSEDPEMLVWLAEALPGNGHEIRVSGTMLRRLHSCEWHVHEDGVKCEASEEARLDDGRVFVRGSRGQRASWSTVCATT